MKTINEKKFWVIQYYAINHATRTLNVMLSLGPIRLVVLGTLCCQLF